MVVSYSPWVQLPDTELIMSNVNSVDFGLDAPEQADVFIRDGTGVDGPRGKYIWDRAFGGPRPQEEFPGAHSKGWKGARNYSDAHRWYNSVDQAEWVGTPTDPWVNPDSADAGGASGAFQYGWSWDTVFANASLYTFWDGSMLSFYTWEVTDKAGQLGTGADAPTSPSDPLYAGLFDPGAEAIEFEDTACQLLELWGRPSESKYKPTESLGYYEDTRGALWSYVHTVPPALPGWGYSYDPYSSGRERFQTNDAGPAGFIEGVSGHCDAWGTYSTLGAAGWNWIDLTRAEANHGGLMQWIVIPPDALEQTFPPFDGFSYAGTIDNGSWVSFRAQPMFGLKATVRPTRIRARYPDPDVPPTTEVAEAAIRETRARFSG